MTAVRTGTIQLGALAGVVPRTALLGLTAAAFVWGARLAIRRRRERSRPDGGERPVALRTDRDGVATARSVGGGAPTVALRIPVPLPEHPGAALSHAHLYALELGVVGGALLAWVASLIVADPLAGTLVSVAMGGMAVRRVRSMAVRTIGRAPMAWLGATALGATIGVVVFL